MCCDANFSASLLATSATTEWSAIQTRCGRPLLLVSVSCDTCIEGKTTKELWKDIGVLCETIMLNGLRFFVTGTFLEERLALRSQHTLGGTV